MKKESLSRRTFIAGGVGAMAMGALAMAGCSSDGNGGAGVASVEWTEETDVVVVGFGGAGASAAIAASDGGANVIVLEKAPEGQEGGNTSVSGGGSNVGLAESPEFLHAQFPDTIPAEEADGIINEMKTLKEWMVDHDAKLADTEYGDAILFVGGNGYSLFTWLKDVTINSPGVTVKYGTPAKKLIFDPATKEVFGVVAEQDGQEINIKAKRGVVMACGGFEADHFKMTSYYPPSVPIYPCGTPYNTGDGIDMVQEVGAKLRGFGSIEWGCHCCKAGSEEIGVALALSFQNPESWKNAIMVNQKGRRFVNETYGGRYAEGSIQRPLHAKEQLPELALEFVPFEQEGLGEAAGGMGLYAYANLPMYLICGQTRIGSGEALFRAAGEGSGNHWASLRGLYTWSADNQAEIDKGWIVKADTLEELAEKTGIDVALADTVKKYDEDVAAGVDSEFGRTYDLSAVGDGPYYACELGMSIINTQGGPERDADHHVIGNNGEIIPRLYAGGEFGSIYVFNYPGALNLPESMGNRVAGANAAAEEPWS